MITRRRLLTMLSLSPIGAVLGWFGTRTRNLGPIDQHITLEQITPTRAVNLRGARPRPSTPPEHIHRCSEWVQTPEGAAWLRARNAWLRESQKR